MSVISLQGQARILGWSENSFRGLCCRCKPLRSRTPHALSVAPAMHACPVDVYSYNSQGELIYSIIHSSHEVAD